jgi:hypothetical protein
MIVCERRDVWAPALRRTLGSAIELRVTRSLAECADELAAAPGCLLAVELTARIAAALAAFVDRVNQRGAPARVVVLAERGLAEYEEWMREAGAVHFETSPRRLGRLSGLVARHASKVAAPATSIRERIWMRLPWGEE